MKDNSQFISKFIPFNTITFVSYLVIVTLLTFLIISNVSVSYQIGSAQAQVTNTSSASDLTDKGISLADLGKYEEAIEWYDKALEIDSKYLHALIYKGLALKNLDKFEESIAWYDKALAIQPKDVSALTNKGSALYGLGNYEEAIGYYDKALEVDPKDLEPIFNKGLALYRLGEKGEAIVWIDKALTIDPTNEQILDWKSRIQE